MQRISLAIDAVLLTRFDELVARTGHANRSEGIRDLIRDRLIEAAHATSDNSHAVGTVTLVYDHRQRDIAERLLEVGHGHHASIVATLHVHLDAGRCLEVIALRGRVNALRELAEHLIGMKGVQHGKFVLTTGAA